jgi:hypothetical protein
MRVREVAGDMSVEMFQWAVTQGVGVAFAALMFWVYRKDSLAWAQKQSETATAFMQFGERYAEAATRQAMALDRQAAVLDRIERHLSATEKK